MLLRRVLVFVCFIATIDQTSGSRHARQIVFEDSQETCLTPEREQGTCILLTDCQRLLQVNNFNTIRRYSCGFEGTQPKVCCPSSPSSQSPRPTRITRRPIATRPPPRGLTPTPRPQPQVTPTPRPPTMDTLSLLPEECGMSNATFRRVVGGEEAEKGTWPWIAALFIDRNGIRSFECGGALVTETHVITAAHCVIRGSQSQEMDPSSITVRLGDHDLYSTDDGVNPIDVAVRSVKRHENFERPTFKNDIAILTLSTKVTFTKFINPVCLPYGSDMRSLNFTNYRAFTCGWGTISFNGPSSSVLRQVQIPVWEQETCRQAYVREVPITDVYMCAGLADGSRDACQGDSGGPLMASSNNSRFHLIGIVSFGRLCGQPGYPGVYTRITMFLDWIRENLN